MAPTTAPPDLDEIRRLAREIRTALSRLQRDEDPEQMRRLDRDARALWELVR